MTTIEQSTLTMPPAEAGTDPLLPTWYTIRRIQRENHDTFTLQLKARDRDTRFAFAPGQFNMLYTYGVGEVPISISGDPTKSDEIIHTTRAAGTVTRAMWHMKRGDTIGVRGPFGTPWPVDKMEGRDLVIVTGGIGLAPLRPVLYHVLANRNRFGRVVLLYGARTPDDLLFGREFFGLPGRPGLDAHITVDRATSQWEGCIGVVTTLILGAGFDHDQATALVCGPEVMMRFTVNALNDRGVTNDRIYVSMERNMKCAVGFCGHCQYGPQFICKDGPVFRFDGIENIFGVSEV
ncbi:MAG: FAD/NAD(P)-binding protein [Planctomycetota bacterium]|jgi:NAD(P)H-flavin reductase